MRRTGIIAGLACAGVVALGLSLAWRKRSPAPATPAPPLAPATAVTRAAVMALAERYASHEWTATAANCFHGIDPDGVRVDTPDADFQDPEIDHGWWVTTSRNIGMPYKWGGFDLPDEFDSGLRAGRFAGDSYSAEKRRLLDDAVSRHAVGIDCSGFVSRCWRLPRSYSTRELPSLCHPITELSLLQPGDILNRHNAHVLLFAGWADPDRTRLTIYEADSKVRRAEVTLAPLIDQGYSAWRYKEMKD